MSLPAELQPDPITVVYQRIRDGLLAHQGFLTTIRYVGHFADMSDPKFERFKEAVQPGDLPEAALFQSAFRLKPFGRNSLSCEIEQAFDLVYTLDTLRVPPLNGLKWHGFVALSRLGTDLGLGSLVRDWNIASGADDAFGQSEWKRGTIRYVSAFRIITTLSLTRQFVADQFVPVTT